MCIRKSLTYYFKGVKYLLKKKHDMDKEIREKMMNGKGKVEITHILKQEELAGKCRMFAKVKLEPGASIGWHEHKNEEEIYYITQGKALVSDNGIEREIERGDVLLTNNGDGHFIKNVGNEIFEMIAIILLFS